MEPEELIEHNAQILAESYRMAIKNNGFYVILPRLDVINGKYLPFTEDELLTIKRAHEINKTKFENDSGTNS